MNAEVDPLKERVSKLEKRVDALEKQNAKWEESLDAISRAAEDVEMLEQLVNRAENAAKKAERSFDMMQHKGAGNKTISIKPLCPREYCARGLFFNFLQFQYLT
jgi:chaperonin cofactor prefoldin